MPSLSTNYIPPTFRTDQKGAMQTKWEYRCCSKAEQSPSGCVWRIEWWHLVIFWENHIICKKHSLSSSYYWPLAQPSITWYAHSRLWMVRKIRAVTVLQVAIVGSYKKKRRQKREERVEKIPCHAKKEAKRVANSKICCTFATANREHPYRVPWPSG